MDIFQSIEISVSTAESVENTSYFLTNLLN